MNKMIEVNNRIKSILNLEREPVGVKFIKEDDLSKLKDQYDSSTKMRYCQALMRAGKGEKIMITPDNIACPASAAAFGLKPLPEMLSSGQMLYNMGLSLASIYETGERLEFNSAIFQATCVDSTVIPFTSGKLNSTLGCYGCREATDVTEEENLIGIPYGDLSSIADNLEKLSDKPMKRARAKEAFHSFSGCGES